MTFFQHERGSSTATQLEPAQPTQEKRSDLGSGPTQESLVEQSTLHNLSEQQSSTTELMSSLSRVGPNSPQNNFRTNPQQVARQRTRQSAQDLRAARDIVKEMKQLQEELIRVGGTDPADINDPNTTLGKWGVLSKQLEQLTGHKVTSTHISEIRQITGSRNPSSGQIRKVLNDKLELALDAGEQKLEGAREHERDLARRRDPLPKPPRQETPPQAPPIRPEEPPIIKGRDPFSAVDPKEDVVETSPEKEHETELEKEPDQTVEAETEPKTAIDKQVAQDMEELRELQQKSREELLDELTPEKMEQRRKDGSLIVLALAIDAKDSRNPISPEQNEAALRNFREDAEALQGKLDEAGQLSTEEKRQSLTNGKYAAFFKQSAQEGGREAVDRSRLTDEQVEKMYDACVLEEHMRSKGGNGIAYESGTALVDVLRGNPTGDCDTVALYADCLVSGTNSDNLKNSITSSEFDGHAQLLIDLGDNITIAKNTSNMQQDPEDPNDWNFYDSQYDRKTYGRVPQKSEKQHAKPDILIGRLAIGSEAYKVNEEAVTNTPRENAFRDRVSRTKGVPGTIIENDMKVLGSLINHGDISATEYLSRMKPLIQEMTRRGFGSETMIQVKNFCRIAKKYPEAGAQADAEELLTELERSTGPNGQYLKEHVDQLITNMRSRPDFDRKKNKGDNTLSVAIENAADQLWDLAANSYLSTTPEQRRIYKELAIKLYEERASWKYENPKEKANVQVNLRRLKEFSIA